MLTHFHCSLVGVPAKECIIAVIYLPYITERDLWKYAVYSCLLSATTITTKATVRILKKSLRKRDMKKTKKKEEEEEEQQQPEIITDGKESDRFICLSGRTNL